MEDPSDLNLYENTENHSSSKNKTSNTVKFCESTRFKGEEGGSKYQNIVQSSEINDKSCFLIDKTFCLLLNFIFWL